MTVFEDTFADQPSWLQTSTNFHQKCQNFIFCKENQMQDLSGNTSKTSNTNLKKLTRRNIYGLGNSYAQSIKTISSSCGITT